MQVTLRTISLFVGPVMAPQVKLIYFNLRGRAEMARLILAQAGVDYEDKRVDKEEWAEMKKSEEILFLFTFF